MALPQSPPRRLGWALLLLFALILTPHLVRRYVPYDWLVGDGGFYLNMQKSLTQHGTLDQTAYHPHSWYSGQREVNDAFSNIAVGRNGEWWPKHSYVMPVCALPFYWLFGVPGTLIFNALMVALMVLLAYQLARDHAPPELAALAALAVGVTGPYVEYAYNYSNDGFYTVLCLGALLAAARDRPGLAGGLFGLAIWAKLTALLVGPVLLALHLRRTRALRPLIRLAAGTALPLAAYGAANWYMFGAPWVTSDQRVLVVRGGQRAIASHTDLFTVPWREGLRKLLLDQQVGLVRAYPLTLVAWLGFVAMAWTRGTRLLAAGLAVSMAAFVLFFARYSYFQDRFLFPYFSLSIIPLAALLAGLARRAQRIRLRPTVRWRLAVGALLVLAGGRIAMGFWPSTPRRLSGGIEQARVYLGTTHCDYFNNMRWSWECSDRNDAEYVGPNARHAHTFGGAPVAGWIFAQGHNTQRPRRIVFPDQRLGDVLLLRYGLDDLSRPPCQVQIVVHVGLERVLDTTVRTRGRIEETRIDTAPLAGQRRDVVVTVRTRDRDRARFVFAGWIE